jgi:hypothetical protein
VFARRLLWITSTTFARTRNKFSVLYNIIQYTIQYTILTDELLKKQTIEKFRVLFIVVGSGLHTDESLWWFLNFIFAKKLPDV